MTVECAAVARATWRQLSRPVRRHAAIDHDAIVLGGKLERQKAGMGFLADRHRRQPAGVHQQHGAGGFEPLIAGMRRIGDRIAARVIIGEHGGQQIGRGRAHAVEQGEAAVAMAEEPQHRHHAIDGVEQAGGRGDVARGKHLSQRQQVGQQIDQRLGIAADMAAVGQDLAFEFLHQPFVALRIWRAWPCMQSAA